MVRRPLAAVIALLAGLLPALAQVPSTLPANTVLGRLGVTAGKPQAIPFATLLSSSNVQPVTANLTALLALGSTGFPTRTGADTWAQRSVAGTTNEITVTNGNGVSGNPTISLPTAMTLSGKTVTGGTFTGGAFNGTVGATTPTTGAFTTATARDQITIGDASHAAVLLLNGPTRASGPTLALRDNELVNVDGAGGYFTFQTYNSSGVLRDGFAMNCGLEIATASAEQGVCDFAFYKGGAVTGLSISAVQGAFLSINNDMALGNTLYPWLGGTFSDTVVSTKAAGSAFTARSGAAGSFADVGVGRTSDEAHFTVVGASDQRITGSVAGDAVVWGASNLWLTANGSATSVGIKLATDGTTSHPGPITLRGFTSGNLTLAAADIAGTNTIRFPAGTTNFSTTGGTSQVVKQTSLGGAFTVARLACSDLSDSSTGCSAASGITALTSDVTATGPGSAVATLATVNSNVGTFGSATQASQVTVNGKGLVTAASSVTVTPAVGSITGLGTGVATALAGNVGSAGAPVVNGGALGSPSSAGTIPAFTLGGTIAGGGNQLNNIIIGTSTPLAGSFTTLSASTSITSPLHIGGSGTTGTQITLKTTTGNGTTDAFAFVGGNNGATTFATLNSTGFGVAITPSYRLDVAAPSNGGFRVANADGSQFRGIFLNISDSYGEFRLYTGSSVLTAVLSGQDVSYLPKLSLNGSVDSGSGTLLLKKQTFASLTACSSTIEGAVASVTDSTTATWRATITGTGANHVLAYCNGTNWTVAG